MPGRGIWSPKGGIRLRPMVMDLVSCASSAERWNAAEVKSGGCIIGVSAGPSPAPPSPWHAAHDTRHSDLAACRVGSPSGASGRACVVGESGSNSVPSWRL